MNIYHPKCSPTVQQYLDRLPQLKLLASELCRAHDLSVMEHNESSNDYMEGEDGLRDNLKVLLVSNKNGFPFCVASLGLNNRSLRRETLDSGAKNIFRVQSTFISKERGKGISRNIRESVSLSSLMKVIKKDVEENSFLLERNVLSTPDAIKELIERANSRRPRTFSMASSTQVALAEFYTESKIITDPAHLNEIKEVLEQAKVLNAFKEQLNAKFDRFKSDLSFILSYDGHTFVSGTINYDRATDKYVSLHNDVNCYSDINELESVDMQLMLTYKMYRIKTETDLEFHNIIARSDRYIEDLDVVTYYSSNHMFSLPGNAGNYYVLFTPKMEQV